MAGYFIDSHANLNGRLTGLVGLERGDAGYFSVLHCNYNVLSVRVVFGAGVPIGLVGGGLHSPLALPVPVGAAQSL